MAPNQRNGLVYLATGQSLEVLQRCWTGGSRPWHFANTSDVPHNSSAELILSAIADRHVCHEFGGERHDTSLGRTQKSTKPSTLVAALMLGFVLAVGGNDAHAVLVTILNDIPSQDVLICDGSDSADVMCTVTVTVKDKGMKKCKLDVDKPIAVVTAGANVN